MSLNYQVLCEDTAMIGVVKQKEVSSAAMEEITVNFHEDKYAMEDLKERMRLQEIARQEEERKKREEESRR